MLNLRNSFPGQRKNESVFIFLRRHYLAYLPFAAIFIFMIIIGIIMYLAVDNSTFFAGTLYNIGILVSNLFLLAAVSFSFVALLDFYFDVHIVTDTRIVDIDQNRLFHRQIDELSLEDVEDVSVILKGFLGTVFSYGSVEIQTAGSKPNFIFDDVPNPREVSQLILDLADQAKRGVSIENRISSSDVQGIIGSELITDPRDMFAMGALTDEKSTLLENNHPTNPIS